MADISLWTNEEGNLLFERGMLWLCGRCPCDCAPRVLVKYPLAPGTVWDLTPYQAEGFAGAAPYERRWQIRECSGGVRYSNGEINNDGTLIGLPSQFHSRYNYSGYMTLQECCIDKFTGQLIEPDCNVW